jgi:molybdenum transport protein
VLILTPLPAGLIEALLAEDVPHGDLTTMSLGIGAEPGQARFTARAPMVVAGVEEAARILQAAGAAIGMALPSGTAVTANETLLTASGPAGALLSGWKVAQTLMEWASGIASATRDIVQAAQAARPDIRVACTRKAAPLSRPLAVRAVLAGGGTMHRLGLSETILLFPEHRAFLPDGMGHAVARLRAEAPERKIVVEVTEANAALHAAMAGADVLQLEKFTPAALRDVRSMLNRMAGPRPRMAGPRPLLAAAGGITAANAAAYAEAGADVLVTSSPYAAPPRDVAVTIGRGTAESTSF